MPIVTISRWPIPSFRAGNVTAVLCFQLPSESAAHGRALAGVSASPRQEEGVAPQPLVQGVWPPLRGALRHAQHASPTDRGRRAHHLWPPGTSLWRHRSQVNRTYGAMNDLLLICYCMFIEDFELVTYYILSIFFKLFLVLIHPKNCTVRCCDVIVMQLFETSPKKDVAWALHLTIHFGGLRNAEKLTKHVTQSPLSKFAIQKIFICKMVYVQHDECHTTGPTWRPKSTCTFRTIEMLKSRGVEYSKSNITCKC